MTGFIPVYCFDLCNKSLEEIFRFYFLYKHEELNVKCACFHSRCVGTQIR